MIVRLQNCGKETSYYKKKFSGNYYSCQISHKVYYNLGIILGIKFLSPIFGVASAAYGVVLGASIFALIQLPLVRRVGFSFKPVISFKERGVVEVFKLMVPRTLSIGVFQLGTLLIVTLISFLPSPGRNY